MSTFESGSRRVSSTDDSAWSLLETLFEEASALDRTERAGFLARLRREGGRAAELVAELEAMLNTGADQELAIEALLLAGPDTQNPSGGDLPDPMVGSKLGSYLLLRRLGRGGMGDVYLGERDGDYRRRVAVKLMRSVLVDSELVARFRRERQILARLDHPGIAQLLDGGVSDDGRPYLVMQLVEGRPVTEHSVVEGLSIEQRLRLFLEVCSAVEYAHRNLVVHRDLKPSNILACSDGPEKGRVKLLDFGIAKLLGEPEDEAEQTRTDLRLLTPEHAAPEQVTGGAITTATDVYALGVLLYELLAGVKPFRAEGRSRRELEDAICTLEPPPPSEAVTRRSRETGETRVPDAKDAGGGAPSRSRLRRRLAGDLDTIVLAALRKEPERRYASVGQLAQDVERHLEGHPVSARPDSVVYRVAKFVRRHAWGVGASAALAVAGLTFAVTASLQSRALSLEQDRVRSARDTADEVAQVLVGLFETANPELSPDGRSMRVGELLDRESDRVIAELAGQPEVQVRMREVLARIHVAHGRFDQARPLLEAALSQRRELSGPDDPETASASHALAVLTSKQGDPQAAEPLLRESLERHRRLFGDEHPSVAQCMQDLAAVLATGDPEKERLLVDSLEMRRRLDPGGAAVASSLNDLSMLWTVRDRLDEAEALQVEALEILGRVAEPTHPFTLVVLGNRALTLTRLGRDDESFEVRRELLSRYEERYGPESLAVANALNNLGTLLVLRRRPGEGETMLRRSLDIWIAQLGEEHRQTANTMRNLARSLELQGRAGEALPLLERATEIARASGSFEAQLVYMEGQVAAVRLRLGLVDRAAAELGRVVARLGELEPDGNYLLADAEIWLGEALLAADAPADAEASFRSALAYRQEHLPEGHAKVAEAQCGLGRALAGQGRWQEASSLLGEGLPIFREWGLAPTESLAAAERVAERARAFGPRPVSSAGAR